MRIEKTERCDEEDAPFDPDFTKMNLRRCEEAEIPEEWIPKERVTGFCPLIKREITQEECQSICSVVEDGTGESTLARREPPIKIYMKGAEKCWECDHPWFSNCFGI